MPKIEITEEFMNSTEKSLLMLIYGLAGVGKSTLVLTASKNNKLLYVDVEGTLQRTWKTIPEEQKNIKNITLIHPKESSMMLEALWREIEGEIEKNDVIVIDKVTELIIRTVKAKEISGGTDQKFWNIYMSPMILIIEKCKALKKTLILVAEEEEKEDNKVIRQRPKCGGNAATNMIINAMEAVGRIYQSATGRRRISFNNDTGNMIGKNRGMCVPNEVEEENLNMSFILNYDKRN